MIDKRHFVAGALTAALLTTALPGLALAQDDEAEAAPYAAEGLQWDLRGYLDADGVWMELPEPVGVTLLLQEGMASGSSGCNTYQGPYEITEDTLTFGEEIATTTMFCEGPGMEVEQAYLALLPEVAGWMVDGYSLSLSDAEGMDILQYEEAVVELHGSDLDRLNTTLAKLGEATAALDESVSDINDRLTAVEQNIGSVNIRNLRDRVNVLEEELGVVQTDIVKLQDKDKQMGNRIGGIETRVTANEAAIADLDEAVADLDEIVTGHLEAYPIPEPA